MKNKSRSVWQRGIAAVLAAAVLWMTAAWEPAVVQAAEVPVGDLGHEDFDSIPHGGRPGTGWSFASTPSGVIASVYAEPSGNHVFRIEQSNPVSGNYGPRFSINQEVSAAELSYRVKAEQTTGFIYLPRFTGTGLRLGMSDSGSFTVGNGSGGWNSVMAYEANRWYDVRVVLDTATDKYDLYIDDEPVAVQRSTDTPGESIRHVEFGFYRLGTGAFSVDDLNVHSFKEAVSASFPQAEYQAEVGGRLPLELTFAPADASIRTAAWSTSDSSVATVDGKGVVTGIRGGTAQITAAPYAAGLAPVTVTVQVYGAPPAAVMVHPATLQLATGARSFLTAEVTPANAGNKAVVWSTSDSAVAGVSPAGEVRGISPGTAVITARSQENASLQAQSAVTVTAASVPAPGDALHEDFETTALGQKPSAGWSYGSSVPAVVDIRVGEAGAGESSRVLSFSQSDRANYSYGVARRLDASMDKAVLAYRIRAKQTSGFFYMPRFATTSGELVKLGMSDTGAFSIWDTAGAKWLAVKQYEPDRWYEVRLYLDTATDKYDLFIDGELVAAQQPAAAAAGAIQQVNIGFYNACIGSFDIDDLNVYSYRPAVSAAFAQSEYTVPLYYDARLKLDFLPADASLQSAVWSSDNPEVAAVDETGKVTGAGAGTAVITAVPLEPGVPAVTAAVYVVEVPPQSLTLDASELLLSVGSLGVLKAAVWPVETTDPAVIWSSSDPAVVSVANGELEAHSPGTAVITASARGNSGIYAAAVAEVVPATVQQEFYVSPDGDDANPGTVELPFRTLDRAQQAVRSCNDEMNGDIVVYLREGTYTLQSTWTLNEEDSGTNGYTVRWSAYPGEEPVVSGGRTIAGWTLHDAANGIYKAEVGGDFASRQLFIDGVRATRARSGAGLVNAVKTASGYTSDDVQLALYDRPQDLEFVYMEQWTNPRSGVASVSVNQGKAVIAMDEPGWTAVTNKGGTSATYPVYYENAYELLDQDGEWYWNEGSGELFYKPRVWENLGTAAVTAPVLEELVAVKGSSAEQQAANIMFTGITFADTTWMRPSSELGHSDAQNNHLRYPGAGDILPPAAVTVEHARAVRFERNVFTRLGITGLKLVNGVQDSLIRGNVFYDISGSAVSVGDPGTGRSNANPSDPGMQMRNNDVVNNYIHDIGVEYMSAAAISAGFPLDMDISSNEIFNIPYSGLHIGYGWMNRFPNILRNMRIEHNFIHDLLGKGIYDGGAIYTLGNSGGSPNQPNLIAYNYIRNQMNDYGALYPDEGSTFWQLDRNVIDLSETPFWRNGTARWSLGNSNQDITFSNNYTTTGRRVSNSPLANVREINTQVYPDADWPAEARDIIAQSGLKEDYADIRANHAERITVPQQLVLSLGETGRLELAARDGKDRAVDPSGLQVYCKTDDPSIASVDALGNITGQSGGLTRVWLYVLEGSLLKTFSSSVYVDEHLAGLALDETDRIGELKLMKDEPQAFPIGGLSNLGRLLELDSITYTSHDPTVTADVYGTLEASAAGSYLLTVEGTWKGVAVSREFAVKVYEKGVAEPYMLEAELADGDGWYVDASGVKVVSPDGQGITLGSPKQFALYQHKQYWNELLDFRMTINASSGWPSVMFRSQHPERGIDDTTYIFTVKPDVLELQRFNGGVRTVIYGSIAGSPSLGGPAIPNTMLPFNQRHRIQLGAVNEENGVRLTVVANGQTVMDYLDTDVNAIRGAGYFGVYARSGTITLEPSE